MSTENKIPSEDILAQKVKTCKKENEKEKEKLIYFF